MWRRRLWSYQHLPVGSEINDKNWDQDLWKIQNVNTVTFCGKIIKRRRYGSVMFLRMQCKVGAHVVHTLSHAGILLSH